MKIFCVWTGNKYTPDYVVKLYNMVRRHLPRRFKFICLTDNESPLLDSYRIDLVRVESYGLTGWWNKMLLFNPSIRGEGRCLYFDLDTIIINDLSPLANWNGTFGICYNFTKLAGNEEWPCKYGSCVMSFSSEWGCEIWNKFWTDRTKIIDQCGNFGDQMAIELIYPSATYLQSVLPEFYFVGYRDFDRYPYEPHPNTSVLIFAGSRKPHNTPVDWIREAWR